MYAIELDHVSKIHPLRSAGGRSLKHRLLSLFRQREQEETITALNDVSLKVAKGHSLGIIGSNGAGKTTMLKLAAGIAEPTSGSIRTEGRILPMLELGAGFHEDLSGYDNIYLQGVLLGLPREDVRRLIPSIIDFAEIEEFIHMPVKHYSSGMFVRLGFAISAHVDPDILLIDEGFSVGDSYFQRKCRDKLGELHRAGCSILLVTHDVTLVESVCQEVIWIEKGNVVDRSTPNEIAHRYKKCIFEQNFPEPIPLVNETQAADVGVRYGNGAATLDYVEFLDAEGNQRHTFRNGDSMQIRLRYKVHKPLQRTDCFIAACSDRGQGTTCIFTPQMPEILTLHPNGGEILFQAGRLDLTPGRYQLTVMLYDAVANNIDTVYDMHSIVYSFDVEPDQRLSNIAGLDMPCEWAHTRSLGTDGEV